MGSEMCIRDRSYLDENTTQVLESFLNFLAKCQNFIMGFADANWIQRIYKNKHYARKFQELNASLAEHKQTIILALQLIVMANVVVPQNRAQEDEQDRQQDERENAIIMEAELK